VLRALRRETEEDRVERGVVDPPVIERRVDGQGDAADRKPWIRGKKALLEATLAKAASLARSLRAPISPPLRGERCGSAGSNVRWRGVDAGIRRQTMNPV
jgi:hypothetical protein